MTGDVVGCNLRCIYCWGWRKNAEPWKYGTFYSPKAAADILLSLSKKSGIKVVRLSGGEPTLCPQHLLELLDILPDDILFILETNGLLIPRIAKELAGRSNIFVRVSLKGTDENSFERITGAQGRFFRTQLEVLKVLADLEVPARPALPVNIFPKEKVLELQRRLLEISPKYVIEPEIIVDYGGAFRRLRERGIEVK